MTFYGEILIRNHTVSDNKRTALLSGLLLYKLLSGVEPTADEQATVDVHLCDRFASLTEA